MSSPVFFFKPDDPDMEAAVQAARDTFRFFWRELSWEYRRIIPGLSVACVKAAFSDDPEADDPVVEHMWLSDVEFDGEIITGTLINSPNELTSVKEGDTITLRYPEITDWMYALGDTVYGGHTVNVMRAGMEEAERAAHDEAWGLDFTEDPRQVRLVPAEFLGQEEDAPQDPEVVLRHEHAMAINVAPSIQEFVDQGPDSVNEADAQGFTLMHSLALAGATRCVKLLLEGGADRSLKTHRGYTALQLAQVLGWPEVVALLEA